MARILLSNFKSELLKNSLHIVIISWSASEETSSVLETYRLQGLKAISISTKSKTLMLQLLFSDHLTQLIRWIQMIMNFFSWEKQTKVFALIGLFTVLGKWKLNIPFQYFQIDGIFWQTIENRIAKEDHGQASGFILSLTVEPNFGPPLRYQIRYSVGYPFNLCGTIPRSWNVKAAMHTTKWEELERFRMLTRRQLNIQWIWLEKQVTL